jgi:hypothetical protein
MLGAPLADRDRLTEWTEAVTPLLNVQVPADEIAPALAASERFAVYAAELIAERRAAPGKDLLTAMLQVKEGQEQLSREELLSLVVTLYSAGHRTTRDLFVNGLFTLLHYPEMYSAIAGDAAKAPKAINEFLRYRTPTMFVARVPTRRCRLTRRSSFCWPPRIAIRFTSKIPTALISSAMKVHRFHSRPGHIIASERRSRAWKRKSCSSPSLDDGRNSQSRTRRLAGGARALSAG